MQLTSMSNLPKLISSIFIVSGLFAACSPKPSSGEAPKKKVSQNGDQNGANNTPRNPNQPLPGNIPPSGNPVNPINPTNNGTLGQQSQNSGCYKADPFICKVERLITEKTNRYRGTRNALQHDEKLSYVARSWSQSQANSNRIGHSGFPNQRLNVYKQEFQINRNMDAENVAYSGNVNGAPGSDSLAESIASEFAEMWWNRWGHRVNMLGSHKYIGVGIVLSRDGSWYATQIFD